MSKYIKKLLNILSSLQNTLDNSIKETDQDEKILKQNFFWAKGITWVLIGTSVSFVGWLAIAKTDEILIAQGKLEPIGKVKEIQIPTGGVAKLILVESGDLVEKGDVLIELNAEIAKQNLLSITDQLNQKKMQLKLKNDEIKMTKLLNKEEIKSSQIELELETDLLKKYKLLFENGAYSEIDFLQQTNKVNQLKILIEKEKLEGKKTEVLLHHFYIILSCCNFFLQDCK